MKGKPMDLISRQAAIDALKEHRNLFCDNTPDTFSVLPYGDKCRVDELDMAIATLINLPSAQPEPSQVARDIATIIENEKDMRVIAQPEPEITDEQAIEHLQSSGWMQNHDKQMYEMGAKEQPQRTGMWINKPNVYGVAYCSECDFELHINDTPYCPNCGARMGGQQ